MADDLRRYRCRILGALIGWRMVFVAAAGVMALLTAVLHVRLSTVLPDTTLPYRRLFPLAACAMLVLRGERVVMTAR